MDILPLRKSFEHNKLFPFQVVYKDTKNPQNELPNHIHEWYEMVYVYKGNGKFFIDQSVQYMKEGDLFLLPGNVIHYAIPDKENPVTSTAVFFDPLLVRSNSNYGDHFSFLKVFGECKKQKKFGFTLTIDQKEEVTKYLDSLYTEVMHTKSGYKQAVIINLQSMLLYLNRTLLQSQNSDSQNALPMWLKKIFDYIEKNFTRQIDLLTLSQYAEVSPEHLSRVFKQQTGLNISEYITTKKVLHAKDLLLHTNANISTVAKESGFNSMPYFHRTFKKYFGMTPSHFRKR